MKAVTVSAAALGAVLATGCSRAFDYDSASPERQQRWLETQADRLHERMEQSLPHSGNGYTMTMGRWSVDAPRRRIEFIVDLRFDDDRTPFFDDRIRSATLLRVACPGYLKTPLAANRVTVYTRFALKGGGTMVAMSMSPGSCASYAQA